MTRRSQLANAEKAKRWAKRLSIRVEEILQAHPEADRDNIRHTLILLEKPPLERLQRSLIRGRATAVLGNRLATKHHFCSKKDNRPSR
jgi:hypothetical protein